MNGIADVMTPAERAALAWVRAADELAQYRQSADGRDGRAEYLEDAERAAWQSYTAQRPGAARHMAERP